MEKAKTIKEMFPKQPKLYDCTAVSNLIQQYMEKGGDLVQIKEGSLGYGFCILYGDGLKTTVIQEVYINCWSSGHKIRMYNKMPKKYADMIEKYYAELEIECIGW